MPRTITEQFASQDSSKLLLIPFITAGDPCLAETEKLLLELDQVSSQSGTNMVIELGFPYYDSIADGPVIQESYNRALARKVTIQQIMEMVTRVAPRMNSPLVAMVSYSLLAQPGSEQFLTRAKQAGIKGFIIPDLPIEESAKVFAQTQQLELDLIQLIAPTTPAHRIDAIVSHCSGFVYCVAVVGITGTVSGSVDSIKQRVEEIRQHTKLPISIGFGIKSPGQVAELRGVANGAIVGSAIVRQLGLLADQATRRQLIDFVTALAKACQ